MAKAAHTTKLHIYVHHAYFGLAGVSMQCALMYGVRWCKKAINGDVDLGTQLMMHNQRHLIKELEHTYKKHLPKVSARKSPYKCIIIYHFRKMYKKVSNVM
jgi:hypothetical protein